MTESPTNAIPVIALSAIGSAILPKSVISPRLRAMSPSILSVIIATPKITHATIRQAIESPPSISSATPKNGTSTIRSMVRRLGRLRLLGLAGTASGVAHRALATRSTPSALEHQGRDQVADLQARASQVRRAVDVGALVRGPADDLTVRGVLDEHHDLVADPLLGPLRGELLDQVGHVCGARADLVLVELVVVRRGLGAVLVGVAEDADDVEPRRDQEVAQRLEVVARSRRGSRRSRWNGPRPAAPARAPGRAGQGSSRGRRTGASGAAPRCWRAGRRGRSTARRPASSRSPRAAPAVPRRAGGRRPGPARCRRRRPARAAASRGAAGRRGPCRRRWSSR